MPIITLLTDFGLADHFVGVVKGVILGICPEAGIVDITHQVKPFAIAEGGFLLAQSWRYFPKGTIHVAVVDPGVGSSRRAILAEVGGHLFVAPDNGLLSLVFAEEEGHSVREITAHRYFRQPVSQTFHGRDVFAPVAAHLAAGVPPAEFGKPIEDATRFPIARPVQTAPRNWTGSIVRIDRFGNLITNFKVEQFGPKPFELIAGLSTVNRIETNYEAAGLGEIFVIAGSSGYYEIAAGQDSAARMLGCGVGAPVELRIREN